MAHMLQMARKCGEKEYSTMNTFIFISNTKWKLILTSIHFLTGRATPRSVVVGLHEMQNVAVVRVLAKNIDHFFNLSFDFLRNRI